MWYYNNIAGFEVLVVVVVQLYTLFIMSFEM